MKHHPILFSTPMIQAIMARKKTQTRRTITKHRSGPCGSAMKSDLDWSVMYDNNPLGVKIPIKAVKGYDLHETVHRVYPPYEEGDQFWVRETWTWEGDTSWQDMCPVGDFWYKADFEDGDGPTKWKPSIFMPRKACRIFLEITEVRVERTHDISEEDAMAEGFINRVEFAKLWAELNGVESWVSNPWVWVVTFKRIES